MKKSFVHFLVMIVFGASLTEPALGTENDVPKQIWDPLKYVLNAETILICEYRRYKSKGPVSSSNPPCAYFKSVKYLKGPQSPRLELPIKFDLNKECTKSLETKSFDDSMMPTIGSKFILFIENSIQRDGMFETYLGASGRIPYTEQNNELVKKAIQDLNR
jgi:hypothetical protein